MSTAVSGGRTRLELQRSLLEKVWILRIAHMMRAGSMLSGMVHACNPGAGLHGTRLRFRGCCGAENLPSIRQEMSGEKLAGSYRIGIMSPATVRGVPLRGCTH